MKTHIINNQQHLEELQEFMEGMPQGILTLDLETDSASEKVAKIHGVGICLDPDEAFYIAIRDNNRNLLWSKDQLIVIYAWIAQLCKFHKLIGHNIIYDVLVFENNSAIRISDYIYSDTILLKHSISEERPFGLKEVSVQYLGPWADKAQEAMKESIKKNGGKTTKEEMEIYKADLEVLAEYCGWDCMLTRKLFDIFEPKLVEEGLSDLFYKDEIMPLYHVTIDMKRNGFAVDVEHFKKLKSEITEEIDTLEKTIMAEIQPLVSEFERRLLDEDYSVKRTGTFPKVLAGLHGIVLPELDGKVTMAKKALEKVAASTHPVYHWYYDWVLGKTEFLAPSVAAEAQIAWFFQDNPDSKSVFNLQSTAHLSWLLFEKLGESPKAKTDTGRPKCDDDFLDSVVDRYPFIAKLVDLKKLQKLSSTYIDGILERQIDGVLFSSMLQFGTTSGRYSSTNPNIQNIPRLKEDDSGLSPLVLKYANAIKKGFVAPAGYKIVNADYSALEPRAFAHVSGDERLREVFRQDLDLYSAIAIDVFGLSDASANPKDKNYLKKLYPEKRQLAKIFCLAVVYGAEANRIASAIGVDYQDAEAIIESYLDAYPELRKYMERCDFEATKYGRVKSQFGRVRHLPHAQRIFKNYGNRILRDRKWVKANGLEDTRYMLKNGLNNAKNFPIQALAAHIVNRAMIRFHQEVKARGLDAWVCAQVHDELCAISRADQAEEVAALLKKCMQETTKISIPLVAEPMIASSWDEAK